MTPSRLTVDPDLRLLRDVLDLRWIALRGGAGIDATETKSQAPADIPGVVQSDQSEGQIGTAWIRLYYEPYRPAPGVNDRPHKDMVVYVDPIKRVDAYLAVQDADAPDKWRVTRLPGYNPWLEKELSLCLRLAAAM